MKNLNGYQPNELDHAAELISDFHANYSTKPGPLSAL